MSKYLRTFVKSSSLFHFDENKSNERRIGAFIVQQRSIRKIKKPIMFETLTQSLQKASNNSFVTT